VLPAPRKFLALSSILSSVNPRPYPVSSMNNTTCKKTKRRRRRRKRTPKKLQQEKATKIGKMNIDR
jgi:hypothetical protein